MIEVDLLPSWYAEYKMDRPLNETELNAFNSIWSDLIDELRDAEKSLVLRDYHSPNIIWRDEAEGKDRIGLIDFQDAVIGPSSYDVASIVQDARIDIPKELESRLVAHYCACRKPPFDEQAFHQSLAIMQAQRATKILGIFVRLSKRDGKHGYLAHLPRIEDYLGRACAHPSLAQLDNWMKTVFPN